MRLGHLTRIAGAAAFAAAATLAQTQALAAEVNLKVLGWYANNPQQQTLEKPFWGEMDKRTKGQFSAQYRSIDELGMKGFEVLRTLKSGAFDLVTFQLTHISGDDPTFLGTDLPGLSASFPELAKLNESYMPVIKKRLQERYGGRVMAVWAYPPQIVYCKGNMTDLSSLAGKKVRVSSAYTAKAVEYLGGVPVTLAGNEVYQALLQGVVDCGITGSAYGNANDWHEVTQTLYPVPLGGSGVTMHVVKEAVWNKLTPAQQATLTAEMSKLEADLWQMGIDSHTDGVNCNTGTGPCQLGKKGKMKLLAIDDKGREKIQDVLKKVVLPTWLESCEKVEPKCRADWNATVGSLVGIRM